MADLTLNGAKGLELTREEAISTFFVPLHYNKQKEIWV